MVKVEVLVSKAMEMSFEYQATVEELEQAFLVEVKELYQEEEAEEEHY